MNEFQASNGITISISSIGSITARVERGGPELFIANEMVVPALREFFRAEEDERVGRWRWPQDPGITVRIAPKHAQHYDAASVTVMIQQDSDGYVGYYTRDRLPEITEGTGGIVRAGHAYFDAHTERAPWHDARPGEVWLLSIEGVESAFYPSKSLDRAFTPVAPNTGRTAVGFESFEIEAGRRIWPEDDS
jgi:hypothetical protein